MKIFFIPILWGALIVGATGCGSNSSSGNTTQDLISLYTTTRFDQRNYYHAGSASEHQTQVQVFSVHDINASAMVAPLKESVLASPVLNQGSTNTCVTMSLLAALGIIAHTNSEYYDPVCSLNLGNYLNYENHYKDYPDLVQAINDDPVKLEYYPSDWKGSTLAIALAQLNRFGAIEENGQGQCGHGSFYSQSNTHMVLPDMFREKADADLNATVKTNIVCSYYNTSVQECARGNDTYINIIKSLIDNKNLALLSFQVYEQGSTMVGLDTAFYQFDASGYQHNVWLYNDNVLQCESSNSCEVGGHDIIVFGYIDNPDNPDEGLLVLRNSWGKDSSDEGNYYMTYAYARNMILALVNIAKQ